MYSHYAQAGWHDFDPTSPMPHTAILEIEMEEPKIMQIGSYVPNSMCAGKVIEAEGISPIVMENHGMPTAVVIGSMQSKAMRGSVDRVSPCLTEAMGMGGGQIPMVTEPSILGYTRDCKGNVESYHEKDMAGTIHTSSGSGGNTDQFVRTRYRIRKLTPTECFRLMGCDDSDIDKLKSAKLTQTLKSGKVKEKPIPKTQLYKMAGNSIVVDVLYHIFHQMFIAEPPKPKPIQKSLFD